MTAEQGRLRRVDLTTAMDLTLDTGIVAYASWTVIYWVCLAARIPVLPAVIAWLATLPLCGLLVLRRTRTVAITPARAPRQWAAVAVLVVAVAAAGLSLFLVRPDPDDVYYV